MVDEPIAAAEQLADLFGRGIAFADPTAPAGQPMAGVSTGDVVLALFPILSGDDSRSLWGHVYERPQTCNLGVRVPALDDARRSLAAAGVSVLRSDERSIVVGPTETGGVTLVVVDQLLPGDPRQ